MQPLVLCSFCHKTFPEQELHDCVTKTYTLLNTLAKEKTDQSTLFQNTDNIVLQGGGVKGLSYLGVLDALLEENPDFLKNLKRVAGNSAGSIAALYIALGLDPKTDMADLMNKNYLDLLDDGLVLKVAYNIKSWFGGYKYKNFTVKDIFTAGFNGFDYLQSLMKQPKGPQQVEEIATEMFTNILQYYSSKFGTAYSVFMRAGAADFAEYATKWLLSILKPVPSNKSPAPDVEVISHPDDTNNANNGNNTNNNNEYSSGIPSFEDLIKDAFYKVANDPTVIKVDKDVDAVENFVKTEFSDVKDLADVKKEDTQFYKSQEQQPVSDVDDKSELTGALLHYSLAELMWFVMISQVDADGMKQQLGLFSGDIVKQELIENSIQIAFKNLNKSNEYKLGLTFKDLDSIVDDEGKRVFKPIFCTSYNTANLRTEVFSVYHTPDVIVSDAIRASMSIPVFFTPVTIRENGAPRRIWMVEFLIIILYGYLMI